MGRSTRPILATIPVSAGVIEGGDITVGGGFIWVRTFDELVVKVDPATNAVVAVCSPASGSGSVAADDSAAWVSAHDVPTIWTYGSGRQSRPTRSIGSPSLPS